MAAACEVSKFHAASLLRCRFFLGGATQKGSASDAVVQFACLPLLAYLLLEIAKDLTGRKWVAAFLGLLIAIPLLQLVPLPPTLWSALPGRAAVLETYRTAGLDLPWLGVSISSWATIRGAFSLFSPSRSFWACSHVVGWSGDACSC